MITRSLFLDRARTWRVVFAIALGTAVTTSVLGTSIGIGDQVERELRAYGANIEIVSARAPSTQTLTLNGIQYTTSGAAAGIPVGSLGQLKGIFWRDIILGFVPFLSTTVEMQGAPVEVTGAWFHHAVPLPDGKSLVTGAALIDPWWKVEGAWPAEDDPTACLVGAALARSHALRIGNQLELQRANGHFRLRVVGILHTGGPEDSQIVAPLKTVQQWTGRDGQAERVEVSALIKPDDALSHKDPASLNDDEKERLICSPYMGTVLDEIKAAVPNIIARPVYRIADSEGKLLGRIRILMDFILFAALLAAVLGAGSATSAAALERRAEMGLLKALGAPHLTLLAQLLAESMLLGLAGGVLGTAVGLGLEFWIGRVVFGAATAIPWVIIPCGLLLALLIAASSSLAPLWGAVQVDPVQVLSEE